MEVTKVSFSYANALRQTGTCGFASIQINGEIVINRVIVTRFRNGEYKVKLPRNTVKDRVLPIVTLNRSEDRAKLNDAVLSEFYRVTKDEKIYKKP